MEFNAKQIAEILQGKVEGNEAVTVNNFAKIEEGKRGSLTFLANPKYTHYIYETKASIALVNSDFTAEKPLPESLTLIRVKDAYASLATLLTMVDKSKKRKQGVETPSHIADSAKYFPESVYIGAFAYIGENAVLGQNVSIYPQAYVGDNVVIGDNTTIYAGVKIYEGCVIGKNCIIHSGAVIGADGFGFAPNGEVYDKIPQLGNVVIDDNVEIGANTTIDRAVMDSTHIRSGVKLDNLIQVAHNVEVGENTVIAAQTGIAGSTRVGSHCTIGGQVGLGGHIRIGDNVGIGAQSGIISNIDSDRNVMGSPAADVKNFLRAGVLFPKLPDIYKSLAKLQKEVEQMKKEH
ncbi:MAG: UDP-3-O-(3-hydroxymyristoyl)glucosamine N-acyltransferase [Dysgonamonadaceae bacterium]|jgi:UDP-3-O-[3-hydroxymyristoyl] glucosamine N-acyltransferase|nr:UDP-3-O-(3-hydroxymyristoyl)glucosamine N-acyltransferase [Dysgonamonadaceae bacterium]